MFCTLLARRLFSRLSTTRCLGLLGFLVAVVCFAVAGTVGVVGKVRGDQRVLQGRWTFGSCLCIAGRAAFGYLLFTSPAVRNTQLVRCEIVHTKFVRRRIDIANSFALHCLEGATISGSPRYPYDSSSGVPCNYSSPRADAPKRSQSCQTAFRHTSPWWCSS